MSFQDARGCTSLALVPHTGTGQIDAQYTTLFPKDFLDQPPKDQLNQLAVLHTNLSQELGNVISAIETTVLAGGKPPEELIEREAFLNEATDRLWEQWFVTAKEAAPKAIMGAPTIEKGPSSIKSHLLKITAVALLSVTYVGSLLLTGEETRQQVCETLGLCAKVCTNWIFPC